MNAQVVCRIRAGVNLTFNVREKEAMMGRDPLAAVSVPVEGVSRQHAKITWDGKHYWLEDLKSTNGTFLNSQAVSRERLRHLDVITLGKEVDLVFVLREAEEGAASGKKLGIVRAALVPETAEGVASSREIPRGEITLGRSPACNIVTESGAVSKVHARIERTADQLVLEDLGSANGTFVNGNRLMTAFLQNGDVLSLAGVEVYGLIVETGEITTNTSARFTKAYVEAAIKDKPRFSAEWKTRFDWDSAELLELANLRQSIADREKQRDAAREKTKGVPVVKGHGAKAAAKPAAAAAGAKTSPPPGAAAAKAAATAAPAAAKPVAPAAPAKPAAAEAAKAVSPAEAKTSPPPSAKPVAAAAKLPEPAPAKAAPSPAAPATPPASAPAAAPAAAKATPSPAPPASAVAPPRAPAPPAPAMPAPAAPKATPTAPAPPASAPPAPRAPAPPAAAPPAPLSATATIQPEDLMPPSVSRDPSGRPTDLTATGAIEPEDVARPEPPRNPAPPVAATSRSVPDTTLETPRRAGAPPPSGVTTKPFMQTGGAKPIQEVRLTAAGFDVAVSETGAHELGRSSDADLRINHPTVSRKHARIIIGDDRTIAYIQDAGGANGTRLNGTSIERLAPLSDGDTIGIGEVDLKVSLRRS
jgi:pSer/pThr/pTyr-binding forkhead associated (FHA) protein